MISKTKLEQILENTDDMKEVFDIVEEVYNREQDISEKIAYLMAFFNPEPEKAVLSVYFLGAYPVLKVQGLEPQKEE